MKKGEQGKAEQHEENELISEQSIGYSRGLN